MTHSDTIGLWILLIALAIVYHGLCMKEAVGITITNNIQADGLTNWEDVK